MSRILWGGNAKKKEEAQDWKEMAWLPPRDSNPDSLLQRQVS